jgi:CheY-like chemotaxis protein
MEALGTLAGGVAHDFNNLLTVIKGYSVLAGDAIGDAAKVGEALEEIGLAANRGAGLTSQLLAFARQPVPRQAVFQVDEAIRGMEKMLARVLGEGVKMQVNLGAAGATLRADPTQFDQVLLNLAVNARDAMPNGGSFEFASERMVVASDGQAGLTLKAGEYAVITATDTGCGIDKTTLGRIFEPFFTTKPVGKGTGLGLSTVYGIMKQNGGHIAVTSEVGKGTTFRLYFPVTEAQSERLPVEVTGLNSSGSETILLVDDDPALRLLSARVLGSMGYRVMCAAGIEEAQRLVYEFGGDIHLLVTDVVMPGGGGELLVEQLGKLHPTTGVLFMSGYTDGRIPEKYLTGRHPAFLSKPFTPAQLAEKVREMLDAPKA